MDELLNDSPKWKESQIAIQCVTIWHGQYRICKYIDIKSVCIHPMLGMLENRRKLVEISMNFIKFSFERLKMSTIT